MPRKESEAVPEGKGSIPQYLIAEIAREDFLQIMSEAMGKAFKEIKKDLRSMNQRLASLEHDARQPRLAMEADGSADKKTRERTESADKVVQAMHGDRFSAKRIQDGPKGSTTFGEEV